MFNSRDIYTSSGSVKVYNSWTPTVAKFDTSSFYNWEQDNLPIYDLDERTYELWEYNGYPTSSVGGLAFTVSGNAPAASLAANRNIFTTVSAAIAAIPRVVRFPVLVEVCNFGNLGKLELNDFQIVENGSIEIINRNYSTIYQNNVFNNDFSKITSVTVGQTGRSYINQFSSIDLSSTLSIGASGTSAVNLGVTVFSANSDERSQNNSTFVIYPKTSLRKGYLTYAGKEGTPFVGATANHFTTTYYEKAGSTFDAFDTVESLDHSSLNQYASTFGSPSKINRQVPITLETTLGAFYNNELTKLSVKNCSGKIYIRNFLVNGGNRTSSFAGEDHAIEILNSDVVLENCTAFAAKKTGFLFSNSKVILSRMAYAYRNYNQTSQTTRSSDESYGFRALNSEITLSALVGGASGTNRDFQTSGSNILFCASNNKIGIQLENSILNGGFQRVGLVNENKGTLALELNSSAGLKALNSQILLKGQLDVYENLEGINLENSKLSVEELCCEFHTNAGITAKNSNIIVNESLLALSSTIDSDPRAQVDFSGNGQHLYLDNSIFTFQRANSLPSIYGSFVFRDNHGTDNGVSSQTKYTIPGIVLTNNSLGEFINSQHLVGSSVIENNTHCYGRVILAENNSTLSLYGTKDHCTLVLGATGFSKQKYIAAIAGKNSSTINLYGPTVVAQAGIDVLVENNSTLNITPAMNPKTGQIDVSGFNLNNGANHTSVDLHATRSCLVANKNSVINMENLGYYANLWTGTEGALALAKGTDFGNTTLSQFFSSGSIRFHPNPFNSTVVTTSGTDVIVPASYGASFDKSPSFSLDSTSKRYEYITNTPSIGGVCVRALNDSTVNAHNVHFGEGSNTGPLDGLYYNAANDCCQHLHIWNLADDSKLRASLLSVSGTYGGDGPYYGPRSFYTSSNAKGSNGTAAVPAFYAPSATPDTGTLSVLDSFGAGGSSVSSTWKTVPGVGVNDPFDRFFATSSYNSLLASAVANAAGLTVSGLTATGLQYGTSAAAGTTYNNKGLFRLYFSVDPAAKYLLHNVSGYQYGDLTWNSTGVTFVPASGVAYQVFSQGYNMSGGLSSFDWTLVSAIHPNLMKLSKDSNGDGIPDTLHPSGFYYCVEFVPNNPTQVIIDESAGNIFANSKNASLGSSGRPKKVTFYRSGTGNLGESNSGDSSNTFISTNIFDLKRDN